MTLANGNDINRQTINRWLMNINMILRCLVQNLTEDAKLTQWNDVVSSVNLTRDEMFSVALLHILHDAVLQILTNTRQLPTEQIKTGFYQSQKSLSFHHNRYDILLIEQCLSLPYISVLHLAELIVYDHIEMMLTLDQQALSK
ncbi:unnamed protein product [Rotaria sp. Silwood2]|nr:unnamed protein product [Rotaria sp. Silwood2]